LPRLRPEILTGYTQDVLHGDEVTREEFEERLDAAALQAMLETEDLVSSIRVIVRLKKAMVALALQGYDAGREAALDEVAERDAGESI
jgi:hypothetical protein